MSTNINSNAMSVPATHALDNLSTISVAEFRAKALVSTPSRYTERARRAGKTDSVGHIGIQLSTDDIVDHVLTINSVCRASTPVLDDNDNPVPLTDDNGAIVMDENGEIVYATQIYPIITFAEAPGYWYNGGSLLAGVLPEWAEESGDDPNSMNYPNLNADLASMESGGIPVYFCWKQGKKRRYVNMILA